MGKHTERWNYVAREKGRNRIQVFERSGGRNFAIECWDVDPGTGHSKRRRMSLGHRDREQAKAQADELASKLARNPKPKPASGATLRKLFDRHEERTGPTLSDERQRYDDQMGDLFCRFWGHDRDPSTLNREDWNAFIDARQTGVIDARGRKVPEGERRPVSPNTVKKNLKALRALMNWSVGTDLLEANPIGQYPFPSDDRKTPSLLHERYRSMLVVAGEVGWRSELALVLAHETGHRIGAILRLRWDDVDLDERLIRWRVEGDKIRYEHVTPMTDETVAALRRVRAKRPGVGKAWLFPDPQDRSRPCEGHHARR